MGVGIIGVMVMAKTTKYQRVISKEGVVLIEAKLWAEKIELLVTLVKIWAKAFKSTEEGKEI
jgi:hypothetical protein